MKKIEKKFKGKKFYLEKKSCAIINSKTWKERKAEKMIKK
jgi:hypothetical protein